MLDSETPAERAYLDALLARGLLIATGVDGVFGRGHDFERVIEALDGAVTALGANDGAERWRFPPLVTRKNFEKSEYLKSFPTLAGSIHSFAGDERAHRALLGTIEAGGDWAAALPPTQVCLTPAACYPVYPVVARQPLPAGGRTIDVQSYCFRHEPSLDPARMQMFRMREHVRLGEPETVRGFREQWKQRAHTFYLDELQLPGNADLANDPFFGRAGKMLAQNQRDQSLKFEMLVPICSTDKPTACASFNYHQDHFGHLFGIKTSTGAEAHTACVGFGLERTALALFKHHGLSIADWPGSVRERLELA
jgi:seryl-tRNA synthetase